MVKHYYFKKIFASAATNSHLYIMKSIKWQVFGEECSSLWQEATPIEALDMKEFKEILKSFKLSVKDLKVKKRLIFLQIDELHGFDNRQ